MILVVGFGMKQDGGANVNEHHLHHTGVDSHGRAPGVLKEE